MVNHSLYIHIPFCKRRCGYCDFNTYSGIEELIPDYVNSIIKEIELFSSSSKNPLTIHTIYFGGGTPSILSVYQFETIVHAIENNFYLDKNLEVTLEANPSTVSREYLSDIHRFGFNRISLGMQSAVEQDLEILGRQHTSKDITDAVEWARAAGFEQINLDLIYGIPNQTQSNWIKSLQTANDYQVEHLSLYCLSVEMKTPLYQQIREGIIPEADPDLAADMYEWAENFLDREGFHHYEISNWAKKRSNGVSLICNHNVQYWRNLPYIGVGSGAHGYIANFRTVNIAHPRMYIQRCLGGSPQIFPRTPATMEITPVTKEAEISETLMMGLRLVEEGISAADYFQRFGEEITHRFGPEINHLIHCGLLEWVGENGEKLRLTQRGHLLGNQVFMAFL